MSDDRKASRCRATFDGLPLALALALAFVLLSALRLIGDSESIVRSQSALQSVLTGSLLHTKLALNIVLFGTAHLLLTALFGIACWVFSLLSQLAWPHAGLTRRKWIFVWSILAWTVVLVANAALYPWSLLGEPYSETVTANHFGVSIFQVSIVVITALATWTVSKALWQEKLRWIRQTRFYPASCFFLVLAGIGTLIAGVTSQPDVTHPDSQRPNIIFIGIDALRHDVPFGGLGRELTPAIDNFLVDSVRFSDAITPLARTFPSWVSTLSGRHPHTTGAVINLLARDMVCTGETLPQALRRSGYSTMYAIDEVRFSNIDASYGFDHTVMPPIGASDFLLGSLNDTPLSNLVSNTRIGEFLFPFSYGNRASAVTYEPQTFVRRFERKLPTQGPVFIAAHLTLAHWPYFWARAPHRELTDRASLQELYAMSVTEVDVQFASMLDVIERAGLLENAIVVVMSDHGEAIGTNHDNPYPADPSVRGLIRLGHGTSVLSPQQYRVVLGVRAFGAATKLFSSADEVKAPVMLTDLPSTFFDLLKIPHPPATDGLSLLPLLRKPRETPKEFESRVRFTESEFNPRGFQPGVTLTASALAEIAQFYELDPGSDRIEVRRDRLTTLLTDRQYAAITGERLLAAVPGSGSGDFRFLFASRSSGAITEWDGVERDLTPEDRHLVAALRARFGDAIKGQLNVRSQCGSTTRVDPRMSAAGVNN